MIRFRYELIKSIGRSTGPIDPKSLLKVRVKSWRSYLVKDSLGKTKPILDSLLADQKVITGKDLIKRNKEADKQKKLLQEAIEFEQRNRRPRS